MAKLLSMLKKCGSVKVPAVDRRKVVGCQSQNNCQRCSK
jgi:hypothetical protein